MTKRIVISGAPGTGKTSLIKELSKRGFKCHNEIAREIIANQLKIGGTITPWQELGKFSELVIKKRLEQFNKASETIEFYDRGIIDSIAYLLKERLEIITDWHNIAQNNKYHKKVFITPPWEKIYINDEERKEDFKSAIEIHKYMIEAYELYNYEICILPKTSIQERIKYLLNQIESQ